MKRTTTLLMALTMGAATLQAKTLVVYYSFTNNCRTIATEVKAQLADADLMEVVPADNVDYAANGYAAGREQITAINNRPNDAASYPAINELTIDFTLYDDIIVATPLWWSQMAAPMQAFLFRNGTAMAGKRIGLIASSASSGISGVVADARRLVPEGDFTQSLWVRSSQVANARAMVADWLAQTGLGSTTGIPDTHADSSKISVSSGKLSVNGAFLSLAVFDAAGRSVANALSGNTLTLQPGVYVVKVDDRQGNTACKVAVR